LNRILRAAISVDIDTLASIYKGYGCRRPGGYTYAELRMGLEKLDHFLEPYQIQSTLFMVGNDFKDPGNHSIITSIVASGHEVANHTMTHAQGFRFLSPEEKQAEIAGMEEICEQVTGRRPRGFRSPGWNISDDALPILKRRGYLYDSSVHPTSLMPLLKFLHWRTMYSRNGIERSTMGHLKYMIAPIKPYHTSMRSFSSKGSDGIMEFPLTVMPFIRLPFFATFLLATGLALFRTTYNLLKAMAYPIQFQFHLSDFVDYGHPDIVDQVPESNGVYVPQAVRTSLNAKLILFQKALDIIANDYSFNTLEACALKSAGPT
jgi:peptidoglycan-N-acetylglucosamine deacetylase